MCLLRRPTARNATDRKGRVKAGKDARDTSSCPICTITVSKQHITSKILHTHVYRLNTKPGKDNRRCNSSEAYPSLLACHDVCLAALVAQECICYGDCKASKVSECKMNFRKSIHSRCPHCKQPCKGGYSIEASSATLDWHVCTNTRGDIRDYHPHCDWFMRKRKSGTSLGQVVPVNENDQAYVASLIKE